MQRNLIALFLLSLTIPASGQDASPSPTGDAEFAVGRPAKTRQIHAAPAEDGSAVAVSVDGKVIHLPWPGVETVGLKLITLGPEAAITRVDALGPRGKHAALLGGRAGAKLLWQGRLDPAGDPGERQWDAIEERGSQESRQVLVGRRHEGVRTCGKPVALLDARAVHATKLTLVDAPAAALPELEASVTFDATVVESLPEARLPLLRFTSTSTGRSADGAPPAPELTDADTGTAWTTSGATRIATASYPASSFPILRFAFAPPLRPARMPTEFWVIADGGFTAKVKVPAKGGTFEVALPAPAGLSTQCLQLVIPGAPGKPVGFSAFLALSALDDAGAEAALVERLVAGADDASEAAKRLKQFGATGARAVLAGWARLDAEGQRRGLGVLAPWLGEPAVLEVVQASARSADPVGGLGLQILSRSPEAGVSALATLGAEPAPVGPRAVATLGRTTGGSGALLGLLQAKGGSERPELRAAIQARAQRAHEELHAAAEPWLEAASPAARAGFALGVASQGPMQVLAASACEAVQAAKDAGFSERFRCALAMAKLPADPEGDTWLQEQATGSKEWMIRERALRALRQRKSPHAGSAAKLGIDDAYPRVRATAATALPPETGRERLQVRAARDVWPRVRKAAVEALASDSASLPTLRKSVTDPSRHVRHIAIDALTGQRDREGWDAVRIRLEQPGESAKVRSAAARYASELCIADAAELLLADVERGLSAGATEEHAASVADSLRALRTLGGAPAEQAETLLKARGAPKGLSEAAQPTRVCPARGGRG